MENVVLGMEEAANAARVSRGYLYRLIRAGRGPATVKIGRRRVIRRQALEEWLAGLEREQAAQE